MALGIGEFDPQFGAVASVEIYADNTLVGATSALPDYLSDGFLGVVSDTPFNRLVFSPTSFTNESIHDFKFGVQSALALSCEGFDPPMNAGPVKVKKNRVLPLKATLVDSASQAVSDLDLVSVPVVQVTYDNGVDPAIDVSDDALPAGSGSDGNQFEYLDGRCRFNLKTSNYTALGSYIVTKGSGATAEPV
ncbi:MAG: hypothetical protein ACI9ON_001525 [Limisphaerales bacterium]|jgi:hypothetical protein